MNFKNLHLLFSFALALLSAAPLWAQQMLSLSRQQMLSYENGIDLTTISLSYIDTAKNLSITQILEQDFSDHHYFPERSPFEFGKQNIWYRLYVENTDSITLEAILLASRNDRITLYTSYQNNAEVQCAGPGFSITKSNLSPLTYGFNLELPPNSKRTYFLQLENFFKLMQPIRISLFTASQYQNYIANESKSNIPFLVFQSCFLACMLFMFLYTILQFSSNYYRGYVYYAFFILVNFFIFLRLLEYNTNFRLITAYFPSYFYCFENLLTSLGIIFYLKFIEYFLQTNQTQFYFQRFITVSISILFLLILFDAVLIIFRPYAYGNVLIFGIEKAINYSILLVALIQVFLNKNILARYIIIGTVALLLGIIYATYLSYNNNNYNSSFFIPSNFAETGVILQILLFSVGLGHKSRFIEREKDNAQKQVILQLQENHKLQARMNEELEVQVNKRTDDMLRINKHYEEQRFNQIQSEFDKKIVETEMAALRAQMNPHFIFNCLNSINLFILKNKPDIASDYLTKFSRLIRLVLDNSRTKLVTLSNEIKSIKLYIELEALRFAGKFGYEIIVDENIDTENTEIPPMLLQPYVENAIWHGLMQYNGEGKITITFSAKGNTLVATIDDNGIGRDLAQRLKSKTAIEHKSHGMKVTAERIDMINKIYDTEAHIEIIDKVGSTGIAFGTTVKIEIPLKIQI